MEENQTISDKDKVEVKPSEFVGDKPLETPKTEEKPVLDTKPNDTEDFSNVGPSKGSNVDLDKYHNKTTKIENCKVIQVPSKFTALIKDTEQHHMQWVLKVSSEILETIGEEPDKIEFRASELFNLIQDDDGKITGFPTGEGSNLGKFCKDIRINDLESIPSLPELMKKMIGKEVTIKVYNKEQEGKTKTYMKFKY